MKKLQKIIAFLLAVLTMLVFAMPAAADNADTGSIPAPAAASPSITINNAAPGKEYRVYKIFDVATITDATDNTVGYSYSIRSDSQWYGAVNDFAGVATNNLVLQSIGSADDDPTVTIYNVAHGSFTSENATAFVEALKTYEKNNNLTADKTGTAPEDTAVPGSGTTLTIPLDDYGYYFVSTSIGALCILDTAAPTMTVYEKNAVPDITKWIVDEKGNENSSSTARIFDGTEDKDTNTGEVLDDIIRFRLIAYPNISLNSKATETYTVHDVLSDGLSLYPADGENIGNFTVEEVIVGPNGDISEVKAINPNYYSIDRKPTQHNDDAGKPMKCDFHINFTEEFSKSLTDDHIDHRIRIEYTATLNENAISKTTASDSTYTEINTARLQYGDNYYTGERTAMVNTYGFGIRKIDSVSEVLLNGAEFELYLDKDCAHEVELVQLKEGDEGYNAAFNCYRPAVAGETPVPITVNGYAEIYGLSSKTSYFIKEVAAPAGYNLLSEVTQVAANDKFATKNDDGTMDYTNAYVVKNSKGLELPTTGGMGTRLFYIFGGALVFIAVVLLITKKRMSKEK